MIKNKEISNGVEPRPPEADWGRFAKAGKIATTLLTLPTGVGGVL